MKLCAHCKTRKPIDEFSPHPRNTDRHHSYCKPCVLEVNRQWRHKNVMKLREAERLRYPRRKQQILQNAAQRKSRMRGLPTERVDRMEIFARDGGRCHICGGKASPSAFHLDHLIPVTQGGGYLKDNLRVAHPFCNIARGAGRKPAQLLLVG